MQGPGGAFGIGKEASFETSGLPWPFRLEGGCVKTAFEHLEDAATSNNENRPSEGS